MTVSDFVAVIDDVITRSGTTITCSKRGHGSVKLATRDSHAAHAFQLRAQRASLTVKRTETDDQTHVLRVTGFRHVPSGPLHTCSTPGAAGRPCAACGPSVRLAPRTTGICLNPACQTPFCPGC